MIVGIQFLFSITAAFFNCLLEVLQLRDFSLFTGYRTESITGLWPFFTRFITEFAFWFILFINLVPISMVVTLETVKFI